jgi:hypothetical protein
MRYHPVVLGCIALSLLHGCGSDDFSSSVGTTSVSSASSLANAGPQVGSPQTPGFSTPANPAGTHDLVIATASTDSVDVVVGATQTISITFTSSDGQPMTGFSISGSSGTLPAGWTGPAGFVCNRVSTGGGCVLELQYAPAAVDNGTLTLEYVVVDDSGLARTPGSLSLPYAATAYDNVVALVSPAGEIDAKYGSGTAAISVNFITDDGNAATNLSITTNLAALPTGWSSPTPNLACAIVSSGSGCELSLTFSGTTDANGVLTLNFSYTDDSAELKTGSVNIPYRTTTANNVLAKISPAEQVLAVQKSGTQAVLVTFTTDDGQAATQVRITSDLTHLPAGWTSDSQSFACSSVSVGDGCQLRLAFAPATLTSGTLTLTYDYTDAAGTARSGLVNIAYAATTDDTVVGIPTPSGQVVAIVGQGAAMVTVSFATDDGRPATALQLTGNLDALPAGWSSSTATFACGGIDVDTICTLPLSYQPAAAASGMLSLGYAYDNNAGDAKTGTVDIAYRGTTDDRVVGTPSPGSLSVVLGESASVAVTFVTDDGNPASSLAIGEALGTLPVGWSTASTGFNCATVSAGTACTLALTYAPTTAAASNLTLPFNYTNDAGIARTGSVSIAYSASAPPPD